MNIKIIIFSIFLIFVLSIVVWLVSYLKVDHELTGGYDKDSDEYYGYSFPLYNNLKNVEDCEKVNTKHPNEPPVSKEWMQGCLKYFENH
ncbi:hypothetical protein [Acinetobacter higginsii]|uniref:hypothetical protein n=1 Tax=Acinetobacter higginsii TaxID=70347 RepID=UPI001F4B91FB|nr:hypothetical protein [Acinetobacter higginsii]MCH7294072.1 hypothetical protein [Acinetobacter higginsii]